MSSLIGKILGKSNGAPPIPLGGPASGNRGLRFNLGSGRGDRETFLRQYGQSGTLYGIISLLAEAAATPTWHLYQKTTDGRRRYASTDQGTDQRREIVQHAAIQLWNSPNAFHSGFEFREGAQQHAELTGETFWVLDTEIGFPTDMWYVRPDRMTPVSDPDLYLTGWIYTAETGEQVPLKAAEVILEKRPDPLDPYRGAGPVASILPNIQQQRYATEYQRNLFLNGADPGGIITVPNRLNEQEFDELIDRWRESHRGVARAGHVGVLEDGMTYLASAHSNRDMEYANLRLANRDELREAWRVHKTMMGTADDVNRANAQTAQEVFISWQVIPRLNRRRDTLNSKLLPLFGAAGKNVEFDFDDPSPVNAENAAQELLAKANAVQWLVQAGYDPHDVLEVVGLPDMDEAATPPPAPGKTPPPPAAAAPGGQSDDGGGPDVQARESVTLRAAKDASAKAFETAAEDFPASAMAWMHHASWKGPVTVPLDHVEWSSKRMDGADPGHVQQFVDRLQAGKKLKPVILVKTPGGQKLQLVDGAHRYLASAELKEPLRAYIATVDTEHGPWESMHTQQYGHGGRGDTTNALRPQDAMRWEAKATDDKNTCAACAANDGHLYRNREAAYADYPGGSNYVKCVGEKYGNQCRCTVVKRGDSTTAAPGDEMAALLRRILSDGYMPIETGRRG